MKFNQDFYLSQKGLQQLEDRAFEIVFDQFESMCASSNLQVVEFIFDLGKEEFYNSLRFEFDVVYSLLYSNSIEHIDDFFIWQYTHYYHLGFDCDFFLYRFEFWQDSFYKNLYNAHAHSMNILYKQLSMMHETFLGQAKVMPHVGVDARYQHLVDTLTPYLLNGKKESAHALIEQTLNDFGDIYGYIDRVIGPIMKRIGILWQTGQISVAKEHLATQTVDAVVHRFIDVSQTPQRKSAIVATVGDELHGFALTLIADFLKTRRYEVQTLRNSTASSLVKQVQKMQPNVVILSITLQSNIAALQKSVQMLRDEEDFAGKIIVGGQALCTPQKIKIDAADFQSSSLKELDTYLQT